MARTATQEQREMVCLLHDELLSALRENGIAPEIAYAATTMLSATLAVQSVETDDTILGEYRRCLLDARTRSRTVQ